MSDDLRAWIKGVEKRRDRAFMAFGDDHAFADAVLDCVNADIPALIAKVEELADAATACLRFFRVVAHCDECNQPTSPIFNSREGYCVVHAVKFVDLVKKQYAALRAPGGGGG